jgi:hypothetical protein
MKNFISIFILLLGLTASQVMAIPVLQLTIDGGTYNTSTETTVTTNKIFNLYSLLTADSAAGDYRLSIAVVPALTVGAGGDYGSFTLNGTELFDVTGDMVFGTPPADTFGRPDSLPTHGIFDTYYMEYGFNFDPTQTSKPYNVTDTGNIGVIPVAGTGAFWQMFEFNVTGLTANTLLHFDLYRVDPTTGTLFSANSFAPFSHDAEDGPTGNNVPEPQSLILLVMGLIVSVFASRRNSLQSAAFSA